MLIKEFDLSGLNSQLINNLDGDTNIEIPIYVTKTRLKNFNKRRVTPTNINKMIEICDYFMIDNTENFIINNSTPSTIRYILDDVHKNKINLPNFMIGKIKCHEIAKYGFVNWLQFAHENGYKWNIKTCTNAAKFGHLNCLKYANENGCRWYYNGLVLDDSVINIAAKYGHLNCLKYAHENGFKLDYNVCIDAASNGHLDCLKYAHEKGYSFGGMFRDDDICEFAASNGHLNCLKYAHENGCPMNDTICELAAEKGHLNCLKYTYENGCKPRIWVCKNASENKHFDCLQYAIDNKFPDYEKYINK